MGIPRMLALAAAPAATGLAAAAIAAAAPAAPAAPEVGWGITLENFFGNDPKKGERPLYIYPRSSDAEWLGATGSSRKKWALRPKLYRVKRDAPRIPGASPQTPGFGALGPPA